MFFRMLKKDLTDSKGLNVIILLFMVIVATLASAGALLLFVNARGVPVSRERCNASDLILFYGPPSGEMGAEPKELIRVTKEHYPQAETAWEEVIPISYTNFDFDSKNVDYFRNDDHGYSLSALPREMNLVYDEQDMPFFPETGCVSIPRFLARGTGLKIGDQFRITTQMGRVYEFTVSSIHKDPTRDWLQRIILSDADFAVIKADSPNTEILFSISAHTSMKGDELLYDYGRIVMNEKDLYDHLYSIMPDAHTLSNTALISVLVSVFLMIAAVFMLLIIIFTLYFSIRSAVKKEERELGIMKALGADTFSFRWLFAAKYVAFAAAGSLTGFFTGIYAGRYLIDQFYYNISYTLSFVDIIPSILSAAAVTVLVILFILYSMRRINQISVMDAIRGETRAESIKGAFHLSTKKNMGVPLFLALSDIFLKFRRYVLLMIAFAAGFTAVMFSVQLRESVMSKDFLYHYYTRTGMDFNIDIDKKLMEDISLGTGNFRVASKKINEIFRQNDIPAELDLMQFSNVDILTDDGLKMFMMTFSMDPKNLWMIDGGQYPVLRNEVMIDYMTANSMGLEIGDTVTVRYNKYTPDRLTFEKTDEEFIITGFVDRLVSMNQLDLIMSQAFDDAVADGFMIGGGRIMAPEKQKAAYAEQIKALFPDNYVAGKDMAESFLGMYDILFSFMKNMMIVVVAGVLSFLVVMYQSIFMREEENEIAMLKSCGFDDGTVCGWQFWRMMLLLLIGIVVASVSMPTVVTWVATKGFTKLVGLSEWQFTSGIMVSVFWVLLITAVIAAAELIVLKGIRKIEIWRIRNE